MTSQQPEEHKDIRKEGASPYELILYNDDYHDFDFVIEKLKVYCKHTDEQAEQSALIAHHNGECSVLVGSEEKIEKAGKGMAKEGLTVDTRRVTV